MVNTMVYIVQAVIRGKPIECAFDDRLCAHAFATGIKAVGFPATVIEKQTEKEAEYVKL